MLCASGEQPLPLPPPPPPQCVVSLEQMPDEHADPSGFHKPVLRSSSTYHMGRQRFSMARCLSMYVTVHLPAYERSAEWISSGSQSSRTHWAAQRCIGAVLVLVAGAASSWLTDWPK